MSPSVEPTCKITPLVEHDGNYYTYSEFQDALSKDCHLFHSAFRRMGQALDLVTSDNDQEMASKFQSAIHAAVLRYNDPEELPHLSKRGPNARMRGCMFVSHPYNGSFNRPGPVTKWAWDVIFQKQIKTNIDERHTRTLGFKEARGEEQDKKVNTNSDERHKRASGLKDEKREDQDSQIETNIDERPRQIPGSKEDRGEEQDSQIETNIDERHRKSPSFREEQREDQDS